MGKELWSAVNKCIEGFFSKTTYRNRWWFFAVCFIYTQIGLGPEPPKQKSNIFHHSQDSRWDAFESRKSGVSVTNLASKWFRDPMDAVDSYWLVVYVFIYLFIYSFLKSTILQPTWKKS